MIAKQNTILVVDDEEFVRESLADLLDSEGYRVLSADGPPGALRILQREVVDLIVTDLSMPEGTGLELLEDVRKLDAHVPVILLTGVGTIGDAVSAMKSGATDFIQKPVDPDQFFVLVQRALEHRMLRMEVEHLRHAVQDLRKPMEMVGASQWFQDVRDTIKKVAGSDLTVLVSGESGTGKELVAAEIHRASPRASGNFVKLSGSVMTEGLFEKELFGYTRDAVDGAVADRIGRLGEAEGGTLVLDDIGTLRPELQAKLLTVLETGEYQVMGESRTRRADVRVIAITNDDLEARVEEGSFRADLYYRLNAFPLVVPPLRERPEDIPAIARYFIATLTGGSGDHEISEAAMAALMQYPWRGNARELRNLIERALILQPRGTLEEAHFLFPGRPQAAAATAAAPDRDENLNLRERTDELEERLILTALERADGVKREAAKLLGIDPKNLGYYLRKHENR